MASAALVYRLTLVDKRVHALVRVLGCKEQIEGFAFELDAVVNSALGGAGDRLFGQPQRDWRSLSELFAQPYGFLDDQLLGHNACDQAALVGLFGAEHAAGE